MALGAYSIVRYSNNLSDQRVNLGIVVWHPIEGFKFQFSRSLDRVQAIDPRIRILPLKHQIEVIKGEIKTSNPTQKEVLEELSLWFKEGLEVSLPYPAQIDSAAETLEHLYKMLVSPVPEFIRASSQRQFERSFDKALATAVKRFAPNFKYKNIGYRKFGKVLVNVGIRTSNGKHNALWHALSLQSQGRPDEQLAFAKATAMDINFLRTSGNGFRKHQQFVALQEPRVKASHNLDDSMAWLKREADEVIVVPDIESLPETLGKRLRRLP